MEKAPRIISRYPTNKGEWRARSSPYSIHGVILKMRLTLRTLLAWLDDTLPPGEVRQIGQQVAESPLASELVDKIHRVTRQRRLTVPPDTGPDGVDANIVAGYLADELPVEVVAEYEKRCLTSDVALAEVASVHQILSLLGQKAKVPAEAKTRMYHLIKGREAATTPTSRPSTRKPEPKPVTAWLPEPLPTRSIFERFGPLTAIAGLILVLCWSAYMSIGPTKVPTPQVAKAPLRVVEVTKGPQIPADVTKKLDEQPAPPPKEVAEKAQAQKSIDADILLPAGSAGVVGQGEFVLLRQGGPVQSWDRVAAGAVLRDGDRIINMMPFLTPIQVGSAKLTLIGDCELVVNKAKEGTSARFELVRGRVKMTGTPAKEPIALSFDSTQLKLSVPEGAIAGLEIFHRRAFGEPIPGTPGLWIIGSEGTVIVEAGDLKEELSTASIKFVAPKTFGNREPVEMVPMWLTDTSLRPGIQEPSTAFANYFKPDRAPKSCLAEALDDPAAEVRADAISGLAAIGQLDLVISTMSQKDNPKSRKAAITTLREVAMRSPETAKELRTRLESVGGSKEWANDVEAMLVGYPVRLATDAVATAKLLALLTHGDVGVRELAIQTLQFLSDRADPLGYDPDKPSDPEGVKAWADLIERNELRIPPAPKSR